LGGNFGENLGLIGNFRRKILGKNPKRLFGGPFFLKVMPLELPLGEVLYWRLKCNQNPKSS